ncbi:MAG TPA: hypothetical protein EYG03_11035 [Planctomycetes bacterium]|nr:hypothetical protein [Planctomycetota bacterium]
MPFLLQPWHILLAALIGDALKQALRTYTQSGGQGKTTIDAAEAVAALQKHYELCCDMLHGLDYTKWTSKPNLTKPSKGEAGASVPPLPFEEVVAAFNETFGLNGRLTDARRTQLRARWRDEHWRDNWMVALPRANRTDQLRRTRRLLSLLYEMNFSNRIL